MKQRGSIAINMIIIAAVLSVLLSASWSMLMPLLRGKQGRASKNVLTMLISNFQMCILDGPSWATTIRDSANPPAIRCLTGSAGCADGASALIRIQAPPQAAYPSQPAGDGSSLCIPFYDSLVPSNGFTLDGLVCSGFSTSGNDACPYHITFTWQANCPGGVSPCFAPAETVIAAVQFSPSSNSITPLNLSDGVTRQGFSGQQTYAMTRFGANLSAAIPLYQQNGVNNPSAVAGILTTIRTQSASTTSRAPVVLLERMAAGTSGGACASGQSVRRQINFVSADPAFTVRSVDTSSGPLRGTFQLAPGTYECTFSAPGYLVGNFYATLVDHTTNTVLIRGNDQFAPAINGYAQTRSTGMGRFTLTAADTLEVDQYCSESPSDPATGSLALGVPFGLQEEDYTVVHCRTYNTLL